MWKRVKMKMEIKENEFFNYSNDTAVLYASGNSTNGKKITFKSCLGQAKFFVKHGDEMLYNGGDSFETASNICITILI